MRALRLVSTILALLALGTGAALADDDEAAVEATPLQNAVEALLADDDQIALPALAEMAKAGDADAQILLGQLALDAPETWSPWRAGLSADQRAAIFGPPGASWTATAAGAGDAGAKALLDARKDDAAIDVAKALHAAGHTEAAKTLAWNIMETGRIGEVLTMSADEPLYRRLDYLWWLLGWTKAGHLSAEPVKWVRSSPVEGRASGLMLTAWVGQFVAADKPLPPSLSQAAAAFAGRPGALVAASPAEAADLEAMIGEAARRDPELAPLGALCAASCDQKDRGRCVVDGLRLAGGFDKLMRLDPPHEPLAPARVYGRSARAAAVVKRLLGASGNRGDAPVACLAAALN